MMMKVYDDDGLSSDESYLVMKVILVITCDVSPVSMFIIITHKIFSFQLIIHGAIPFAVLAVANFRSYAPQG